MSAQQGNGNDGNSGGNARIPFGKKAAYVGSGILIGLIIYPFVKKSLGKVQPRMDDLLDKLTGKAENLAEKASDLMARARETLSRNERRNEEKPDAGTRGASSRRSGAKD